ncbi:unnamed protein product, partial [marine sediment metagenome]
HDLEEEEEDENPNLLKNGKKVYTQAIDYDLETLNNKIENGKINPNPDFQRRYVWDNKKASRLIESFLLDIPIPLVYLSEEDDNSLSVIDGQQRLISINKFLRNDLKLSLGRKNPLTGKRFKDLDEKLQNKIINSGLRGMIIKKESDPEIKFEIFARLNRGSVQLNDAEIRNCIYRGEYNELLIKLAQYPHFQEILNYESWNKRMIAEEMILRFFAFFNKHYTRYKGPMRQFLNNEMELNQDLTRLNIGSLIESFKKSV